MPIDSMHLAALYCSGTLEIVFSEHYLLVKPRECGALVSDARACPAASWRDFIPFENITSPLAAQICCLDSRLRAHAIFADLPTMLLTLCEGVCSARL